MLIRILMVVVSTIVVLIAGGWLGLRVKATRFPVVPVGTAPRRIPIPPGLPTPVERFAQALFGDTLPDVQSAIVLGRAQLAPTGMPMPTRFRFYYDAARLVVQRTDGSVWILEADGTILMRLPVSLGRQNAAVAFYWSPDSQRLACLYDSVIDVWHIAIPALAP